MRHAPGRDRVVAQAKAALEALEAQRPGATVALRNDALLELDSWDEVEIEWIESVSTSGNCEVAGSYRKINSRAILTISTSGTPARHRFTALHELGHHVQRTNRSTARVLAAQPHGERQLEEQACDEFAARILIPDDVLSSHIAAGGPTAAGVVNLMSAVSASRSACCVAAARRLVAPGHVLLLDSGGELLFAASVGLPRPPGGSDQSNCTLIRRALGGRTARVADARLTFREGDWQGEELFGDAAWHGQYLVAVLTTDSLPWGGLAIRSRAGATSPTARMWHCGNLACQNVFPAHRRCEQCGQPKCPQCDHCACVDRQSTRACTACQLELTPSEVSRGMSQHIECP